MKVILVLMCFLLAGSGFIHSEHNRRGSKGQSLGMAMSGDIANGLEYKVVVDYIAAKDVFWCQSHAVVPFTYTHASRKTFEYYPTIANNRHSIDLSLNELSWDKGCRYRPVRVSLLFLNQDMVSRHRNTLLIDPGYNQVNLSHMQNADAPGSINRELSATCFDPVHAQADDPDMDWYCRSGPKVNLAQGYDFNSREQLVLQLDLHRISHAEYRSSCFFWGMRNAEKCQ